MVIYRYFEIEIHKLPPINRKAANTAEPIQFGDLPDKEIIRKAVEIATPTMKPIIYLMSSSGCAKRETLNLTIKDYIDALSEYTDETNIYDIIDDLGDCESVVPTFSVYRQKTGKHYTTYCSPEAISAINTYLLWRLDTLADDRPLFKVDPNHFTMCFIEINNKLRLGKVGNYNRFRSHMLRKFHASTLYNDGMSMEKVNDLQGKAKNRTDSAYFMINPEDLKQEYIKHLPALAINQEVKKLTVKSPEFLKMEKEEYKKEFSKRPCVEGPFGIFKEQYHVNQEIVIGMVKTEERLNLDALAYNIKRLYNLIQGEQNKKEDIVDFCESISTTHQLKLDVNIY